ncbi:AraC family transcriptional regulator [Nocardia puris]|uniref:AraC family transcriptional regulator n=1 Tax=Nocardia puris TaxID=208602 RepID=A0A366E3X0_9NOCA|nr:AraC family transcriptional regulator [Nocardia puris]MBF6214679.1 AraC family transcriptional regulator [Nocardia puris]MBF6368847.1 AraC family transcriptional regulator [Nocardia puris]MBF6462427.1 AraC family transcriptional regulator [Nocardia puris]RBO97007.1 AraC family transcriptional regulator [Nocardia puris]
MGTDQVLLHRFVISQLTAAGLDRDRLIKETGLPVWTMSGDDVHLPSQTFSRLWELAAHGLGDPDIPLRVAHRYELRSLGLYDYLFATAPTLGEGLATCGPYVSAVTTNHRFDLVTHDEHETALYLEMIDGEGLGRDLTQLWGLSAVLSRARRVVDGPLVPLRVTLRRRAPADHRAYVEVFGTDAVEFEADADALVFRTADMSLPLTTADPVLAKILRPLAAALPPPPPLPSAWPQRVADALADAFAAGDTSLDAVARRLATSPRTLQRRLMEAGTTWRKELDRARADRLRAARATGPLSRSRQAQLLGYSDAGSIRRAARRWRVEGGARQAERFD